MIIRFYIGVKYMENRITATQAVREFSELLNKIRFRGEHYIIVRNGRPVAQAQQMVQRLSQVRAN